MSKALCLPAR